MIESEGKKLDLMQSMGNGREDRDTTYHFFMSLWEPINRLLEDRRMFLRMKILEMIFQEIKKQKVPKVAPVHLTKGTQSSTSSSHKRDPK